MPHYITLKTRYKKNNSECDPFFFGGKTNIFSHPINKRNQTGVLLSGLGLIDEILQINPSYKDQFKAYAISMTHVLRNLVSNYTLEYDVSGVSDPFLQIAILKFFRIMAENNLALSEDFSDILTQVSYFVSMGSLLLSTQVRELSLSSQGSRRSPNLNFFSCLAVAAAGHRKHILWQEHRVCGSL